MNSRSTIDLLRKQLDEAKAAELTTLWNAVLRQGMGRSDLEVTGNSGKAITSREASIHPAFVDLHRLVGPPHRIVSVDGASLTGQTKFLSAGHHLVVDSVEFR